MPQRLAAFLLCLCVTAAAASADQRSKLAPADEYFGRLKMSVLGIQNVIKDMRLRVEADPGAAGSIFGGLAMVEDAIRDWERKYPQDTWIAKDLLALEITYLTANGEQAHAFAVRTEAWMRRDYAGSPYAAQGRDALLRTQYADDSGSLRP